jgi:hypothetical protein
VRQARLHQRTPVNEHSERHERRFHALRDVSIGETGTARSRQRLDLDRLISVRFFSTEYASGNPSVIQQVQLKIQLQDIDSRLSKKSELSAFGMPGD